MHVYSVYFPAEGDRRTRLEKAVLVKDGFSWPALFFSWLFLAFHRMWIVLILYSALMVIAAVTCALLKAPPQITILVLVGISVLLALEASGLRGWSLSRRGYEMQGMITAANLIQAEAKLFENSFEDTPSEDPAREQSPCESPS